LGTTYNEQLKSRLSHQPQNEVAATKMLAIELPRAPCVRDLAKC
jgi:hypothetical protein